MSTILEGLGSRNAGILSEAEIVLGDVIGSNIGVIEVEVAVTTVGGDAITDANEIAVKVTSTVVDTVLAKSSCGTVLIVGVHILLQQLTIQVEAYEHRALSESVGQVLNAQVVYLILLQTGNKILLFFNTCLCGGNVLLTFTIEKIIFLSSAISRKNKI